MSIGDYSNCEAEMPGKSCQIPPGTRFRAIRPGECFRQLASLVHSEFINRASDSNQMAKEEHEREDLLRDAKAYDSRAQWHVPFCLEPVFVGFRANGGPSFYFGQDEVYHFNSMGQLRRAFIAGKLLKAEGGRLVELTRERTTQGVQLLRRELSVTEADEILTRFHQQVTALVQAFSAGAAELDGEVLPQEQPPQGVSQMINAWSATHRDAGIAAEPNSG